MITDLRRRLLAIAFALALAGAAVGARPQAAHAVPSYARQMDMPCNGCHVQFPVLNSFGRRFKLSGYTLTSQPTVGLEDEQKRKLLDSRCRPCSL